LRHKLQKGLVTRDKPPQPNDMEAMDEHLSVLEQHQDLEPAIIKETKVNKLLKVILKLHTIPRDDEFKFKERCQKLLTAWTHILSGDGEKPKEATPNGVSNGKAENPIVEKPKEASVEPAVNGKVESTEEKKTEPEASAAAEASKAEEPVEVETS
jgi:hypothetical protein